MDRLSNVRIRKVAMFAVAGLSVALCALAMPQAAYAYTCWYKLYDIDGNLIYTYDNESGATASAESVDINTLQQGVKYEFFYDGGDGDPLPSISSMSFDVKIYDGSDGASPNYGLKDASAMSPPITEIRSKHEGYDGAVDYDENGYFIGSIKQSGTLLIKTVSPGSLVCFQISCLPYVRGIGGSPKYLAGIATYAVSALTGNGEADRNGGEDGASTEPNDPGSAVAGGEKGEPADADADSAEEAGNGPRAETDRDAEEEGARPESNDAYSVDANAEERDRADAGAGEDSTEDVSGVPRIVASGAHLTGKDDASDDPSASAVALAAKEPHDGKGGGSGGGRAQSPSVNKRGSRKAGPAGLATSSAESGARPNAAGIAGEEGGGAQGLESLGTVFAVGGGNAESGPARASSDKQIAMTGLPLGYVALVALLALMLPAGAAARLGFGKRKGGAHSRLLSV